MAEYEFMLPLMVILPLIGAIITLAMGGARAKFARYVAALFSVVTLIVCVAMLYVGFDDWSVFDCDWEWITTSTISIHLAFSVDGLSVLMVLLAALLTPLVMLFSSSEGDRPNYFYTLLLAMEVGLIGVFTASDFFLFYVMWEVSLIPMYFLISWYGGPRRHYAAIKFFIYTHVASLVMLIGIFAMGWESMSATGVADFSFAAMSEALSGASEMFQVAVFALFFFGFMVKMPSVPFHTWLPDAHVEAPTAGSVLLAGVMLKMGSYGIIRICLQFLPEGAAYWQWVIIAIGLLSMVYGAYACIAQTDLKKMVAFSSISHMGMVMVGIGCLSDIGITFAVFQMFAHGLISAMLFMVCGFTGHSLGTREIPLLGGLAGKLPIFATFMMFAFMASLGLPGLVGFWGEFPLIYGFYEFIKDEGVMWLLLLCLLTLMLTAGYYLWSMQRTLFGPETKKIDLTHAHDISKPEFAALAILAVLVAVFGIWPDAVLSFVDPYVDGLVSMLGVV